MRRFLFVLLLFAALFSVGRAAHAQSEIDEKARGLLIDKLSRVHMNLAPSDSSKVPITLRLADLYSERARFASMKEIEAGCTKCTSGREDRLKALSLYKEVLAKVPESSIGKVLTQVGHLYEMTGNERDAVATYEKIIREGGTAEAKTEAHLALGEVMFKRRNFPAAREHFTKVAEDPQAGSRGLANYRIAWCELNEGHLQAAIERLTKTLKTPELLTRNSSDAAQADRQFQEEVSRDLATFLARRNLTPNDATLVYELSPENARVPNVVYLAGEAERLGQTKAAIGIWKLAQEKQSRPEARLEGHVHLAQLEMSQKMNAEAVRDFEQALGLFAQLSGCPSSGCSADATEGPAKEFKTRLRNFVVDWNRAEKKQPSEALLQAYQTYLKVFNFEADMVLAAARVAQDLKHYPASAELYAKASDLAVKAPRTKESDERLETAVLGGVEVSELTKDPKMQSAAYASYLAVSRSRAKALDVEYQSARLLYDQGDNKAAAEALHAIVNSKEKGSAQLRKQAADLSLDALVLLKDDARLEAWAGEYAKALPGEAADFGAIARKSVLTQTRQNAEAKSPEALAGAWATLTRFEVQGASSADKITYYKNKLILAEKMKKFADAREAAEQLLKQPGLSTEDQEFALSRKAWLAELILDFDGALVATERSRVGGPADRQLKLAMYAELASKDAKPYYGQFLKESKDDEKNAGVAAQMVRDSKDPVKEIEKWRAVLVKRPELLGSLYLEAYGKNPTSDIAQKALAVPAVASSASGKAIARSELLSVEQKLRAKMASHELDGSTQKKLATTLKARVSMLSEVEKLGARAIQSGDWTSQLVTLDLLAKESQRFYEQVLSLPVPAGLSPEDESQYLSLLTQQAAPHQTRATEVSKKVSEFWADGKALDQLALALSQEPAGPRRALLTKEVTALSEVAPPEQKTRLTAMMAAPTAPGADARPSVAELEKARRGVRENPMDRSMLENLLALERKFGRAPMVAYLENRIQSLKEAP